MQGHTRNGHTPGALDEVEQVPAGRLGVGAQELSDGAGKAGQQLAVGASRETMMRSLNDLFGRKFLLGRGCGTAEVEQACYWRHFESGLGVEEKVAEQAPGKVVAAALFEEAKGSFQNMALRVGKSGFGNGAVLQPTAEGPTPCRHGSASVASGNKSRIQRRS
jgi:hypothetical protein